MILEKTKQLVSFVSYWENNRNITSLIKLIYLIDAVSMRKNRKQISELNYKKYLEYPFDIMFYLILEMLIKENIIKLSYRFTRNHMDGEFLMYTYNESYEPKTDLLSYEETLLITEILDSLVGYGAKQLTETVNETEPMKNAKIGEDINLEKI